MSMDWIQQNKRSASIVAATLALPLAIGLYVIIGFLSLAHDYQQEIDQLQPRISRLMGMAESETQLASSAAEADKILDELVYPAAFDVSVSLQQRLLEVITSTGITVSNSQILPSTEFDSFEKIEFRFTVNGSVSELDEMLGELAVFKPLVLIESLEIEPNRLLANRGELSQQRVRAIIVALSLQASP